MYMHFIHTCMIYVFLELNEFAFQHVLSSDFTLAWFIKHMTLAYSHLILMTPFLSSNGNDRGSGTISCCEGLKIPVTCWSKRIQYKKGRENNSAAQKDKADSRCICIRVYLQEDVHINASDRCECNAKEPGSRWRARSNENTLLKPSAEWRRAVC